MDIAECHFELHEILQAEIRNADGYTTFEPGLSFHIGSLNAFQVRGKPTISHVVIMHSREQWLREALTMVRHLDKGVFQAEYKYALLGTEFSIIARPQEGALDLYTAAGFGARRSKEPVGRVGVSGFIEAVVNLSRTLSDLFHRLQPELESDDLYRKQERELAELSRWLDTHSA